MSDNLLREIDEEVRRENLKKIWDRYGVLLIAAAVLIVAGTAGYRGYEAWQANRSAAAGDRYLEAIEAANAERFGDAATLLQEIEAESVGSYPTLARLRSAALQAQQGDVDGAVAAFEAVAADSGADRTLRDLAALRAAHLLVDTASYDDIRARVEAHASATGTWRHFAREILGLSAFRAGDASTARTWLEALTADPQAPQNARTRAELILAVLGGGADGAPTEPDARDSTTETQ